MVCIDAIIVWLKSSIGRVPFRNMSQLIRAPFAYLDWFFHPTGEIYTGLSSRKYVNSISHWPFFSFLFTLNRTVECITKTGMNNYKITLEQVWTLGCNYTDASRDNENGISWAATNGMLARNHVRCRVTVPDTLSDAMFSGVRFMGHFSGMWEKKSPTDRRYVWW